MKVPFFNASKRPVTYGSVTIMPGACRDVESHYLNSKAAAKPPSRPTDFDVDSVLELNLGELEAAIPDFTDGQLTAIKDAEEALENPRKGAVQLLNVAILSRADVQD